MKKIILSIALLTTLVSAEENILGEFGQATEEVENIITFDAGVWYMNWNQTSTSSEMLKNPADAYEMDYNIDSSMATVLALKMSYWFLSGSVEYSNNSFGSGSEESISNLDMGVALLDYIPYIDVELRYVKADFKGAMTAVSASENGSSDFETKVDIFDIIIYPFNDYVGVGYRNYNYEFPQDVYITHDTSGDLLAGGAGLVDLAYEGYFYTLALDNKKQVDKRNNYSGLMYSALFGMGKLTPSAIVNEMTNQADVDLIDSFMGDSDATFYDIMLAYTYKEKSEDGFGYGFTAGYRYNKIETDASDNVGKEVAGAAYSIKTKFDSEFHGPYLNLVVSY